MADPLFPRKKSIFIKTYSKVQPLKTFVPDFPSNPKGTRGGSPTIEPGKPFPFVLHVPSASITPTMAPTNSPSSDSTSSETPDVEIFSSEVEKQPCTEEEDDKTFITLAPGTKKSSKKQNKTKSCNPLQNISNVIRGIHSSKTVPKRTVSPFMWTCTKLRPQGRLASIQESDQESSSSDDPEYSSGNTNKPKAAVSNKKPGNTNNPSKDIMETKMPHKGIRQGEKSSHHLQSKKEDSPMIVQGRGVFSTDYSSALGDQRSTQLYGSPADPDELSTVTYTREPEETSGDSTLVTSDTCSDGQYSTTTDTFKEDDFSEIEIPRDVPGPTSRVMKQLTPKVAQLFIPETSVQTTPRKTTISTTKAMPRKYVAAWHNRKPTVKAKNSTLLEGLSALNIQDYGLIEEISDIKEENDRPDLESDKITSTPTSRNTVVHQRFISDVSSIEGDACALPSIDAMQSLNSTMLADKMKASTGQKPEVKIVSAPSEPIVPAPKSVYSLSSTSGSLTTPLSIKGRKVLTLERASPRMSSRVSFGQYSMSATRSSTSAKKNTSIVSTGSLTRNTSSNKQVKFLLSNKAREVVPDPDLSKSLAPVLLPELSPSSSILKKRESTTADSERSMASKVDDPTKNEEPTKIKKTGRARMTSTPQRQSRRIKGAHMLDLSFDVSAVDLPSCNDDDLITLPSDRIESKAAAANTNQVMQGEISTATGRSTQELLDFEPIPLQVSASISNEPSHPGSVPHKREKTGSHPNLVHVSEHLVHATQVAQVTRQEIKFPIQHTIQSNRPHGCLSEAKHPVGATTNLGCQYQETRRSPYSKVQEAECPVSATRRAQDSLQEAQRSDHSTHDLVSPKDPNIPVQGTTDLSSPIEVQHQVIHQEVQNPVHATPRAQLKRSSPNGELPGRPNKKRFLEKGKPDSVECTPQTCHRATQKDLPRQQKKLEYADKAVGPPECIISRLGSTPLKPARFWQYVNNIDALDYERIKNMPQDILETIPDAVFS